MSTAPDDLTLEEVNALAGQVKVILSTEQCHLSPKQDEWAFDLIWVHDRQQHQRFTPASVAFMWQVARGDYAACRW